MTDRANNPEDYWYIRVPKALASKPNFHLFDRVGFRWQDGDGNCYYDIGEVIGIKHTAGGNQPGQWFYQMRYLRCEFDPFLNGSEEEYFEAESRFVADDTVLEGDE